MDVSFLKIMFTLLVTFMVFLSVLINFIESKLPVSIVQMFKCGKLSSKNKICFITKSLEVPKRWFKHFYIFASIWSTLGFILVIQAYVFKMHVPGFVSHFLDTVDMKYRRPSYNATAATVAMSCMLIHCVKRCYESHFLTIFSKSNINIPYYFLGYVHYFGCVAAILAESPAPLTTVPTDDISYFSVNDINIRLITGVILFLWAIHQQYLANVTLVNLRKNQEGKVITYEHKIPTGGLFDKISCPHLFCEVLIYAAIYIILWGSQIWPFILFWVLANQCEYAMLNHKWYQSKFEMYPKERYAIIPNIL